MEATKNWVGKTSRTKLYLKDIINLITSFSWLKKRILDTDGHMTNCIKNNLQKEPNYDCRAYPSAVGRRMTLKMILNTDGHMTNCTKKNLQKDDCRAYPSTVGHVINFA